MILHVSYQGTKVVDGEIRIEMGSVETTPTVPVVNTLAPLEKFIRESNGFQAVVILSLTVLPIVDPGFLVEKVVQETIKKMNQGPGIIVPGMVGKRV